MKIVLAILFLSCLFSSCKNKSFSTEQLTKLSVTRQAHKAPEKEIISTDTNVITSPIQSIKREETQPSQKEETTPRFHIIVASYATTEKLEAEKLVQKLKAAHYPASLLFSAQRYRVSIASFNSEKEANLNISKYQEVTKRKDIWIYKDN